MLVMFTGCITTRNDETIMRMAEMAAKSENKNNDKKVFIDMMEKDKVSFKLEVIMKPNGDFVIPVEKIITQYSIRVN